MENALLCILHMQSNKFRAVSIIAHKNQFPIDQRHQPETWNNQTPEIKYMQFPVKYMWSLYLYLKAF